MEPGSGNAGVRGHRPHERPGIPCLLWPGLRGPGTGATEELHQPLPQDPHSSRGHEALLLKGLHQPPSPFRHGARGPAGREVARGHGRPSSRLLVPTDHRTGDGFHFLFPIPTPESLGNFSASGTSLFKKHGQITSKLLREQAIQGSTHISMSVKQHGRAAFKGSL